MSPIVIAIMVIVGAVVLYAAINNKDPRDVVKEALRR